MKKVIILISIAIFIIALLHLFRNRIKCEPYEAYVTPYIWQKSEELSEKEEEARETWISNNPGWKCELYDEVKIDKYIKRYWPSIKKPMNYELWRYLILKTHGGVYSDINTECLKPITEWEEEQRFETKDILVIGVSDDKMSTSTIYCTKEHPVMNYVCEYILNNYEEKDYIPLETLEQAIMEFLKEEGIIFKDYKKNPGVFHEYGIYFDSSKSLTRKAF